MNIVRSIQADIAKQLKKYPILAITGPRQSGKTTLLKNMFPDYKYLSLENPDNRAYANNDPKAFMDEYSGKIIFDEVQRVPAILSYLQGIVDDNKVMGQFILSGSQNMQLMSNITQTLAGRVGLFKLFPFDFQELRENKLLNPDLGSCMSKGFYPAIYDREINPDRYYSDYMETYVNRDISELSNIHNTSNFKRFVKICANRAGSLINYNNLARDAGISHTTASNWISLLETSYIVFLLPPYFNNFNKRLTKSPKLYFYDTGLLTHLLNIRNLKFNPIHKHWGHVFENLVVSEMIKQNHHFSLNRDYYFWRDSKGHEVDLLYRQNDIINCFEIKSSTTIKNSSFDGLNYFSKVAEGENLKLNLIYGGDNNQKRTNYKVRSWSKLYTDL